MPVKYLLDTCVVSETAKKSPDKNVVEWLGRQRPEDLYLAWLTVGELQKGIAKLGNAVKSQRLTRWLQESVLNVFANRILPVEKDVVAEWGCRCGEAERAGRRLPQIDSLIAATAVVHKLTLVTRNVRDMRGMGAKLLNPFEATRGR